MQEPPLNQAIELKRLEMVKLLLVKGAELDTDTLRAAILKEDRYVRTEKWLFPLSTVQL